MGIPSPFGSEWGMLLPANISGITHRKTPFVYSHMVGFPSPLGGDSDDGGHFDDYEQFAPDTVPESGTFLGEPKVYV